MYLDPFALIVWVLVGWSSTCGTLPGKRFPLPPPKSSLLIRGIGVLGGLAGGLLFSLAWPLTGTATAVGVAATAVGAWAGGKFLMDVVSLAFGKFEKPVLP